MRNTCKGEFHFFKKTHPVAIASIVSLTLFAGQYARSDASVETKAGEDVRLLCPKELVTLPEHLLKNFGKPVDQQAIELEADSIEASDQDRIKLIGNAQLIQGSQAVFGDELQYDKTQYLLQADGNVTYYSPSGDKLSTSSMQLELETQIGQADNVDFVLASREAQNPVLRNKQEEEDDDDEATTKKKKKGPPKIRADVRGEAERLFFEGQQRERLENVSLTTCKSDQDDVFIVANEMTLDHSTGIGYAKGLKLRFFDVPIFYLPRVSFPISAERKTGFLFPSIGHEEGSGTIIEVPYYINIAPDADATLTPRLYSRRGIQLGSEFRYLGESTDGIFLAEYLPSDDMFNDDDRYAASFVHTQNFAENWQANIDVETVSDEEYFDDFVDDLQFSSATHLPQRADVGYFGRVVDFSVDVIGFDTVADDIPKASEPYDQLPAISLDLTSPRYVKPFRYELDSEIVNFDNDARVNGTRTSIAPSISLPMEDIFGFITPKFELAHIQYSLDNTAADQSDDPSVTAPIFSIDSGLFYERDAMWNGSEHYQSLEPRIQYVYIPEEDQSDFPNFDTSQIDFNNFTNIFKTNRFFGGDRIGDTNQFTIGVTTRLFDEDSGDERLSASIGQVYYLDDREINLISDQVDDESSSDLVGDITADLTEDWSITGFAQWDTGNSEFESSRFGVIYDPDEELYDDHPNRRRYFSFGFLFDRDSDSDLVTDPDTNVSSFISKDIQQIDISATWPLSDHWRLTFDELYSIEDSQHLLSRVGIGYDACCWAVWFSAQRRVNLQEDYRNSFFITLEFDQLGALTGGF